MSRTVFRSHSAVICAKTAEQIEMPFGMWTRVSPRNPRNQVLDGSPEVQISQSEGAILGEWGAHCEV